MKTTISRESEHRFVLTIGDEEIHAFDVKPSELRNDAKLAREVVLAFERAVQIATPGLVVKLETVARDPARDA